MSFTGKWKNDLGSEMEITETNGMISGTYRTNVGTPDPGDPFDVTGWADGDLIGFTVRYDSEETVTAWVGRIEKDGTLHTLWQLISGKKFKKNKDTKQIMEVETKLWEAFSTNKDVFTRLP